MSDRCVRGRVLILKCVKKDAVECESVSKRVCNTSASGSIRIP